MLRRTRLAATTAVVLVPIAVATGSGAPPLPVAADLVSEPAPAAAAAGAIEAPSAPTPWVSPALDISTGEPHEALAARGAVNALDVPSAALAAYQRATAVISQVDAACALNWELLAAVGRVESDHGRFGGAVLKADGTSTPAIRGPVLNGKGSVAAVADTDAGQYDGNPRWDRAIGPMQFLPSTWAVVGVDADGDGARSADDIDDAALGAAVYLCAGDESLNTPAGARAALLRYNPSAAYATRVLAVARAYERGRFTAPFESAVDTIIARSNVADLDTVATAGRPPTHDHTGTAIFAVEHPTAGAEPSKPPHPPTEPTPSDPAPVDPSPADPTPSDPSPSDPTPADPTPADPTPADPTPTDPTPTTPTALSGTLTACGTTWCVSGVTLDLGGAAYLGAAALSDFDGDGTVESNGEEIGGLVGTGVAVKVEAGTARVVAVNGLDYAHPAAAEPTATP